jgi:hypothetical protein
MVHKTKKYNRFKKIKDIKRRYTKKQNYYGGAVGAMSSASNAMSSANNAMMDQNNAMMYGPAATYNYSGNMVQPQGTNYEDHNIGVLNDVGKGLDFVGSKTASLNAGIHDFNQKTDDVKESIGDGLNKVATGALEIVKDTVSDVANLVDLDTIKQASVASSIMLDAMEEPIVEATKVATVVLEQAAANAGTTAVNVATDVAAAAPGVGAVMEASKLANDVVYGFAKGAQAGAQLIDIVGSVVDATQHNVDKTIETLKKIEETGNYALQQDDVGIMPPPMPMPMPMPGLGPTGPGPLPAKGGFKNFTKQKAQIGGRINDSISEFADPIGYQSSILKGGNNNKTKKSFIKNRKMKSRRVHFSL